MVLGKPKGKTNIAYQYWAGHKKLYTKPAAKGAKWMDQHAKGHPGNCNLFVWGYSTGHHANGKTLVCLNSVDVGGGDLRAQQNVT